MKRHKNASVRWLLLLIVALLAVAGVLISELRRARQSRQAPAAADNAWNRNSLAGAREQPTRHRAKRGASVAEPDAPARPLRGDQPSQMRVTEQVRASAKSTNTSSSPGRARRSYATAPAAVPAAIRDEPDPSRRAARVVQHRVVTARARMALLRRRQRLLRKTIADDPKAQSSPARLDDLTQQLSRLEQSLAGAERAYQDARDAAKAATNSRSNLPK